MTSYLSQQIQMNETLNEKLPITINGCEKYATGLTKRTTVDDVKFAMLSVSDPTFRPEQLEDYGIFEKWQGNERLLDGKIKIYKLMKLWQSLPGDQLSQVKFMIRKKRVSHQQHIKLAYRDNLSKKSSRDEGRQFAFCTLSPANDKTWTYEKAKRRSSYIEKQLRLASNDCETQSYIYSSLSSRSPSPRQMSSNESSSEYDESSDILKNTHRRYASIKRFNRSKKSTIKHNEKIKKSFIELVSKQNEIIDKQLNRIADLNQKEDESDNQVVGCLNLNKSKYTRSRSLDKTNKAKNQLQREQLRDHSSNSIMNKSNVSKFNPQEINENDVCATFDLNNDLNTQEYTKLCKDFFKVEHCLSNKLKKIEDLKLELEDIQSCKIATIQTTAQQSKIAKSIIKTNKKLLNSMDTAKMQTEKLNDLSDALTKIDDIILVKSKFIQSLEQELERLESASEIVAQSQPTLKKNSLAYTSTSSTSSTTSTSSVFTSISSISPSQAANYNFPSNPNQLLNKQQQLMQQSKIVSYAGDNESDTGISSANSDDFNTQLETLV
jgi:hypothetical protein